MNSFRLANPAALLLLLLPLAYWLAARANVRWRIPVAALRYSRVAAVSGLPISWRVRARWLPDALRLAAWVLLVCALARPQSGRGQDVIRGQGLDIVLALDISESMSQQDLQPNRLEAAKRVLADFVAGRQFDRVGLVVFASDAYHHVPPTLDYAVFSDILGRVRLSSDYGLPPGTAVGLGLASAGNMLRTSTAPSKVIVLLTDGANTAGALSPIEAAQSVAALGVRVYTIGVGRPDVAQVSNAPDGPQTVESDLREDVLAEIAALTGGLYFRAEDTAGLQRIYDQIDALERSDVERQVFVRWREQAGPLLLGAVLALVAERGLRATVFQGVP